MVYGSYVVLPLFALLERANSKAEEMVRCPGVNIIFVVFGGIGATAVLTMIVFLCWFWILLATGNTGPFAPGPCGMHMFFFAHTAGNVPQPILPRRATSVRFRPHPSAKNPRKTTSCHINNSVRSTTPPCQHLLNRFQTRTAIAAVDRPYRTASKVTRP